jgi:hypothetical protein
MILFSLSPDVTRHAVESANLVVQHLRANKAEMPTMLIVAALLVASYAEANNVSATESLLSLTTLVEQFAAAGMELSPRREPSGG